MTTSKHLAPLGLGLALLFASCPGEEPEVTMDPGEGNAEAAQQELEEATKAFDSTLEEAAGEIDAAAEAAGAEIDESNAEAALEQLTKDIEGGQ